MHRMATGVMAGTVAMIAARPSLASAGDRVTSGKWSMVLPLGLQAKDETVSCASCHNPFHGVADSKRTSAGVGGKVGIRNSPTLINRLFSADQFWDGRAKDLEHQVPGALMNPVTMAMGSETEVAERVRGIKGYAPLFRGAHGARDQRVAAEEPAAVTVPACV